MDIELSRLLGGVHLSMVDTAQKSLKRTLPIAKTIKCRVTCSHCCKRKIKITVAEAIILQNFLKDKKEWDKVKEKCKELIFASVNSNDVTWYKMNIECPILKDDMCMTYEIRPPACSTHFSISNPESCSSRSLEQGFKSLDFIDLYNEFRNKFESQVDNYGILQFTTHIPLALLLAEKVQTIKDKDLNEIISLIHNEFK